jgi:hypothetical protein
MVVEEVLQKRFSLCGLTCTYQVDRYENLRSKLKSNVKSDRAVAIMMADNQLLNDNDNGDGGVGDDGDIFVYVGGEQQVPRDVKRVRIAENIDIILEGRFDGCEQLIEVEGHNKLKIIKEYAFYGCYSLRSATKMQGLIEIEACAFYNCYALSEMEFDKLEIIDNLAFCGSSLRSINMPSIRRVGPGAFNGCEKLTSAMFGGKLERIEQNVFYGCTALRRIVIPLKDNLIIHNGAFDGCHNLSMVDALHGEIHETISSLHMESWRNEMQDEIDRISPTLLNTQAIEKGGAIQQWIARVLNRIEYYKSEHQILLKEAMALLELALWKAKLLDERGEKNCVNVGTKKVKIDAEAARKEHRVTCGASIVIKNVLPFLELS